MHAKTQVKPKKGHLSSYLMVFHDLIHCNLMKPGKSITPINSIFNSLASGMRTLNQSNNALPVVLADVPGKFALFLAFYFFVKKKDCEYVITFTCCVAKLYVTTNELSV